ncbi:MAG: transketolase [Bacteroidales bacterium]|jgi:transketolase|nr:transketolase [Bacteroidales bacterium]
MQLSKQELPLMARQIRRDIVRMINAAHSGHTGGSLGTADYFSALFFGGVLRYDPSKFTMSGQGEDMFFLSNGHIAPVLYATMARAGYFPLAELGTLRQLHSRLQGHPSIAHNLPGIRIASGSLGQGLSNAVGAAVGKKMDGCDKLVYVLMGDGELEEGQIWEAAMFAGAKKKKKHISTVDPNGLQIDGSTDEVMNLLNIQDKFRSFGWEILSVDGHNINALLDVFEKARALSGKGKPVFIDMKTEMGHGVDFMTNLAKWHGTAPSDEQTAEALKQLEETPFGDY